MKVKSESEVAQSCPTLSDPMDCSPPGSSIHGIFQARVQEWGAIAFSQFQGKVGPNWSPWVYKTASEKIRVEINVENQGKEKKKLGGQEGFLGSSAGKESSCNVGDLGSIPGWEDPLEKRTTTHSSILAWKIP